MLKISNLTTKRSGETVLDDINLQLSPHKITALVGKNGSGKSTLISCINQELRYTGSIFYGDNDLTLLSEKERSKFISILPQLLKSVAFTVYETVAFGRNPYLPFMGKMSKADEEVINRCLSELQIDNLKNKLNCNLSGGERQLCYFAMTLAQNSRLAILDEPTTFLDKKREKLFWDIISSLPKKHKKTVLIAMHDIDKAFEFADEIVVLDQGKVQFFGNKSDCIKSGVIENVFSLTAHEITIRDKNRLIFLPCD